MELGAGSRELGARHMEIETLDDQMIRRQTVTRMAGFLVRRKIAWSRELGAGHIEVETSDIRRSDVRLSRA